MSVIENNGYIATASQIEALVRQRIEGGNFIAESRTTYLRCLLATAQDRLGISPKAVRTGSKVDEATLKQHALALEEVHEVFYAAVQKAAKETAITSEEPRPKADVIASRIVFARSAYSTARNWLMRGKHPLNSIVAAKATKASLVAATPKREGTSSMARVKVLKLAPIMASGKALLERIVEAAKADKDAAIAALHDLLNLLSRGFDDLGQNAVSIRKAVDSTTASVLSAAEAPRRKAA
jgi:hypothetical protein